MCKNNKIKFVNEAMDGLLDTMSDLSEQVGKSKLEALVEEDRKKIISIIQNEDVSTKQLESMLHACILSFVTKTASATITEMIRVANSRTITKEF